MIGSGKNKKKRRAQLQAQLQAQANVKTECEQMQLRKKNQKTKWHCCNQTNSSQPLAQPPAEGIVPATVINKDLYPDNTTTLYCPYVNLTDSLYFSLFRKLILASIGKKETDDEPYTADMLQSCVEPQKENEMESEYRDYIQGINPAGKEKLENLLLKDANNNYVKPPILFKTIFNIPVEIINSGKFVRKVNAFDDSVVEPPIKQIIMNKVSESLNNTNCGCKMNWYMEPATQCPTCNFPLGTPTSSEPTSNQKKVVGATHCPDDPCGATPDAAPVSIDLLLPDNERPFVNGEKMQVTMNTNIKDATSEHNNSDLLSDHPYYIALNLFNSSFHSASHTSAIIVYKNELYSIGFSNWAGEGQNVSHYQSNLDARISSPEDYTKSILYQIQDAIIEKGANKSKGARIALQNYQIIDMGLLTEDMCNKINEYLKDIVQIKATPLFDYVYFKDKICISNLMWEPELEALPSQRTYSRVNACYYSYAPIELTGAALGSAIGTTGLATAGACLGGVCGAVMGGPAGVISGAISGATTGAKVGALAGATVGTALPAVGVRYPGYLSNKTQPPKTVDPGNKVKTVNCAGFIEDIFGINCSNKIGTTFGQASSPTNCWIRLSKNVLREIITAITNNSVSEFEAALKKKTQYGNPWDDLPHMWATKPSGGKTTKKRGLTKNRKTRKHFRKINKTRKHFRKTNKTNKKRKNKN